MSKELFTAKSFPNPKASAVLFFVCAYGTTIRQLAWSIKRLQQDGLIVVAYQTPRSVMNGGDPQQLALSIKAIQKDMRRQIEHFTAEGIHDFGFFGSSLGSFMMYHILATQPELRWGVFNAGGDVAYGAWRLRALRRGFERSGITETDLVEAWRHLQYPEFKGLTGNHYLFLSSDSDALAPLGRIDRYIEPIRRAGARVDLIPVRATGHNTAVGIGLLRCRELVRRIRSNNRKRHP